MSTNLYILIINAFIALSFLGLTYVFILRKQNVRLNWSIFYATLYTLVSLPIVNHWCVAQGFWDFSPQFDNALHLPYELYFLWTVIWGVLPVLFFKGKFWFGVLFGLLWIDLLVMPLLEFFNIISLNNNWLWGECILLLTVFLPGYLWGFASLHKRYLFGRAILQVIVMAAIFLIGLPFILKQYSLLSTEELNSSSYITQLFLIIVFPSLVAVQNLVVKGKGTPFPYDKTKNLVRSGVYAYIRNPIQWSFTLVFLPLAIYYNFWLLLSASLISVAYVYGISDPQEGTDMEIRYKEHWLAYKKAVPKWFFLWKPHNHSKGIIYFDHECPHCSELKEWFEQSNSINLEIANAIDYPNKPILQATYIDEFGNEFKSVKAIGEALNHINLAYATLGWFINFPVINFVLQTIIDSMEFGNPTNSCRLDTKNGIDEPSTPK